jgi:pSer/pThr/pTyr-binding forkhead associated (FHA) protein
LKKIALIDNNNDFQIIEKELNIGRSQENDIVIPDNLISKKHCKITRLGEYSLSIEDKSTNGTTVLTMDGDIIENQKEIIFKDLQEKAPYKLLLGEYDFYFSYPEFSTKSVSYTRPKETILIKNPGVLSIENVELVKIIFPQAAAAMIRMILEDLIQFKKKNKIIDREKMGDRESLCDYINYLKHDKIIIDKMHKIRLLGNMGAHNDPISINEIENHIKILEEIKLYLYPNQ